MFEFFASHLLEREDSISGRAFLPASVVKNVTVENPGVSKKKLKALSSHCVTDSDESHRLEKIPGSPSSRRWFSTLRGLT